MNLHVPFAKNLHNWRWVYTFPWQKLALFVSPFTLPVSPFMITERSPLWRWNSQWVHTFRCQKIFRPLCSHSFKWRDQWSKTQDQRSNPAQSYIILPSKKWIKLIPKTIGNRKGDCAWGGSGWETLPEKIYRSQSTNQEGVRSVQRTDLCFVICRLSQVKFIPPSHLRHNLFFYFQ